MNKNILHDSVIAPRRVFSSEWLIPFPESCVMRSLNPTTPVLPIGVSRHFRAAACVHSVTSPNKLTVNGRRKSSKTLLVKQGGGEWLLGIVGGRRC